MADRDQLSSHCWYWWGLAPTRFPGLVIFLHMLFLLILYAYVGEEFLDLPAAALSCVLATDQLTCSEESVWEALESWVAARGRGVSPHTVRELVGRVRFGLMEPGYYRRNVRYSSLVGDTLGEEIERRIETLEDKETGSPGERDRPRSPSFLLFTLGGWVSGSSRDILLYDKAMDSWRELPLQVRGAPYTNTCEEYRNTYLGFFKGNI